MEKDVSGKLSLDIMVGLTIFLLSFIFVVQYVPTIFAYEREDLTLYPLAYRISAFLVEDPGYWSNGTANGTDWENYYLQEGVEVRPGLMGSEANLIDVKKVNALTDFYVNAGKDSVRKALGLETPTRKYNFNISLQLLSSTSSNPRYSLNQSQPLLVIGDPIPDWKSVVKYERIVAFENATFVADISSNLDTPSTTVNKFTVTPPVSSFVVVILDRNTNETASEPWMNIDINNVNIISVTGNDTIGIFDITDVVNQQAGSVEVTVQVHNVKGYVIATNAGNFIGGKIVAKLVVAVW